ncbi:hypothetical protein D0N36_06850 [Hymenobacter lapidiphilus]|uniref:hypothetical protein n=1 Tax=Hymenobacter sp. CCM 8763 TaxID=2303334 RepID=UPI000E347A31|nr:hypothetical protein [Hymenobacter sp. CCM 8763]RFP65916.1 hypothetical protein D0N36_06850 [Hymenobacter sp. CCM 8763]
MLPVSLATPWLPHAEHLRQTLAQLDPTERRRILDYITTPPEPPKIRSYPIGECMAAARRVAQLLSAHPSWSQAHARRDTAREMGVSTVQLRRMLAHAEGG